MTQEEKARAYAEALERARAYDEALERARPLYEQAKKDGNPIWSTYEYLIPELAESEDEKMINELQGFLDSFGADYFGTGEWQKFHDWLEKQKESLHISETCKENPNSFTNEDERIRQAIIHYILYETKGAISEATEHTWVKWLEKQKERKPAEWSDDIEQAAARYERENRQCVLSSVDIVNAFIEGAKWQEGRR